MLCPIHSASAMSDMRSLQLLLHPTERVVRFCAEGFLCNDGTLVKELDGRMPERITFADHLGPNEIGGGDYGAPAPKTSAEDFADILVREIQQAQSLPNGQEYVNGIKNIDILGCAGGIRWVDSDGVLNESFAEVIARKLTNAGYNHIRVNTLTPQFIGDDRVTTTILNLRSPGQYEFYGLTDEGARVVFNAHNEQNLINEKKDKALNQWVDGLNKWQQLVDIPVRTPAEEHYFIEMGHYVREADDAYTHYELEFATAVNKARDSLLEYGITPAGKPGKISVRDALDNPLNEVKPRPVQFAIEQLKVLSKTLASTPIQMSVLSEPPIRIQCVDEFSFQCFQKILEDNKVPYFRSDSSVIEFSDPEAYFEIATYMIELLSDPSRRDRLVTLIEKNEQAAQKALAENFIATRCLMRGELEEVYKLLKQWDEDEIRTFFKSNDINKTNQHGFSLLHTAASHNDIPFFKVLLSVSSLDVHAQSSQGTARDIAELYDAFEFTDFINEGRQELTNEFQKKNIREIYTLLRQGIVPIQDFFTSNDVNTIDDSCFTLLHYAAMHGDVAFVKQLLAVPNIAIDKERPLLVHLLGAKEIEEMKQVTSAKISEEKNREDPEPSFYK